MGTITVNQGVWSYSGDPSSSAKDQLRYLLGDTDPSDPLLNDRECLWVLGQYNNVPLVAAVRACEGIIAKFSRLANESVGQVRIDLRQKAQNMRDLQTTLRNRLAMEDCAPFAGGISISQKQANCADTDLVRPDFKKHMMENYDIAPWVTQNERWLWLNYQD